ncbi:MAG: hypothetical protein ACJ76K_07445 [Solirubrobacteraceae bacterium]
MRRPLIGLATVAVALSAIPAAASAAPTVRTGAGADAAAITPARDAYRTDLGGGTTAGPNGSFDGVRREINWDGVPEAQSSPNNLNPAFFNTNSPRGAVFETPGSGVQVSSNAAPQRFGNLNATYETLFKAFSPQKLFTPIGSNVTDVKFFVPGTTTPASITGFGAVFADVDAADTTTITYYDESNKALDTLAAPPADAGLSFLGASYPAGTRVSRVRIRTGNTAPGPNDGGAQADVVVMDDFLYGEPQEIKAPAAQGGGQPAVTPAPAQVAAPVATLDTVAPSLKAAVRKTLRLAALRKAIKAKATCDEPCSLVFDLRRGSRVLAHKSLGLGAGTRSVRLKPSRRALRRLPRHATLKLRVVATDQSGNRSIDSQRISVLR